jgi:primosomal protein N' (replication factor Y)
LPSFKSVEKTFQLITQVAGRSGRGDKKGKVLVQTSHMSHYAIECARKYDFQEFYRIEMKEREKMFYPPFCDVAKISIRNRDEKKADEDSNRLLAAIKTFTKDNELNLNLLGPACAYIAKLNNIFRRHIIIKGDRKNILRLSDLLENFKSSSGTFIGIEIMPSDLI